MKFNTLYLQNSIKHLLIKHLLMLASITFIATLLLFWVSTPVSAKEAVTLKAKGVVKYKRIIKVYNASLLTAENVTQKNLLNDDRSKCLVLDYRVNLSVDKFKKVAAIILNRQNTPEVLNKLQSQIDTFHTHYKDVKKGDQYKICYYGTDQSTTLHLNQKLVTTVPNSSEFAKVYLGMWLGNKLPISPSLLYLFNSKLPVSS